MEHDEALQPRPQLDQVGIGIVPYQGGMSRMWYFSASHDRLVFQLSRKTDHGNEYRYLVLFGCVVIAAPVMWAIQNLAITALPCRDGVRWYELSDESVRVVFRDCSLLDRFEP